jgi:hypothetical protein
MPKRVMAGLAIWTLIVGCCFALSESRVATSQEVTTQAPITQAPSPPPLEPEWTAGQHMQAFERHARFNMILYSGRFGQGDLAATRKELQAIALDVKSSGH